VERISRRQAARIVSERSGHEITEATLRNNWEGLVFYSDGYSEAEVEQAVRIGRVLAAGTSLRLLGKIVDHVVERRGTGGGADVNELDRKYGASFQKTIAMGRSCGYSDDEILTVIEKGAPGAETPSAGDRIEKRSAARPGHVLYAYELGREMAKGASEAEAARKLAPLLPNAAREYSAARDGRDPQLREETTRAFVEGQASEHGLPADVPPPSEDTTKAARGKVESLWPTPLSPGGLKDIPWGALWAWRAERHVGGREGWELLRSFRDGTLPAGVSIRFGDAVVSEPSRVSWKDFDSHYAPGATGALGRPGQ